MEVFSYNLQIVEDGSFVVAEKGAPSLAPQETLGCPGTPRTHSLSDHGHPAGTSWTELCLGPWQWEAWGSSRKAHRLKAHTGWAAQEGPFPYFLRKKKNRRTGFL